MTDEIESTFEQIESSRSKTEALSALQRMADYFLAQGDFHRLFETRKFQSRIRAGLPPFYVERPSGLSKDQSDLIENELLDACREVGTLLANAGKLGQAWPYLQPLDDSRFVEELIERIPATEEKLNELIDIGFYQRAHPKHGYQLVLSHLGTCQAISAFDSMAPYLTLSQRREMAGLLLSHIYKEISTNIESSLKREGCEMPVTSVDVPRTLTFYLESFPEQVARTSPHLDATHLVAVMRISRIVDQTDQLKMGIELARYGNQLPSILQYAGEVPFDETYPDHLFFLRGLIGDDPDSTIEHFNNKFQKLMSQPGEQAALETLIELLRRIGRVDRALELAIQFGGKDFGSEGLAPSLIELGLAARHCEQLGQRFRTDGDLLGYAALILTRRLGK
jgi:hypothetical protein